MKRKQVFVVKVLPIPTMYCMYNIGESSFDIHWNSFANNINQNGLEYMYDYDVWAI